MKQSCRGIPFNLITETEISSKKDQASTIFVIRFYSIKNFSSGVFSSFIHDIRRLYPKKNYEFNLKEQLERTEPYR